MCIRLEAGVRKLRRIRGGINEGKCLVSSDNGDVKHVVSGDKTRMNGTSCT
jgi:hypothetical protein